MLAYKKMEILGSKSHLYHIQTKRELPYKGLRFPADRPAFWQTRSA